MKVCASNGKKSSRNGQGVNCGEWWLKWLGCVNEESKVKLERTEQANAISRDRYS